MSVPYPGIDTYDQPIQDAWWTPGWTVQNQAWLPAPSNPFNPGTPQVTYVNVTYQYRDMDNSPLGGFLTFMPSDNVTLTIDGTSWRMPQRLTGIPLPVIFGPGGPGWASNQFGSGKVYIQGGLLAVALMPTDLSGLVTDCGQPLTYHVIEHMPNGRQFDITVPSASSDPVGMGTLIIFGSTQPYRYDPMFPLGIELDDATTAPGAAAVPGTPQTLIFSSSGTLATINGDYRLYNDSGASWVVTGVRASAGTAPTGTGIIVDVLANGSTIFTNQAHRPQIAAGQNTSGNVTTIDAPTVLAGQYLTVNIAQVGSVTPGSDLTVQVEVA